MLALDKADIEDIANGYHNRYVESQDKDELLRELAERLLKATPDVNSIDDNLDNISDCLDDIDDILINAEDVKDGTYDSVSEKITDIEEYLGGVRDVLQSITE